MSRLRKIGKSACYRLWILTFCILRYDVIYLASYMGRKRRNVCTVVKIMERDFVYLKHQSDDK